MNNAPRNAWNCPTGHDTLLNGGLIAAAILGLLLAVLDGPLPVTSATVASGVVVSEATEG